MYGLSYHSPGGNVRQLSEGEIKIVGPETEDNTVSVDVLVKTLQKLQKLVLLAAASQRLQPVGQRFRASEELRKSHVLRCGLPAAGSYSVMVAEVDEHIQDQLPEIETPSGLDAVYRFADAVKNGRTEEVRAIAPESTVRNRLLMGLQELAPSEGSRWALDFRVGMHATQRFNYGLRREVARVLKADMPAQDDGYVIGELQKIDFDAHEIHLRHPVTQVPIRCSYFYEIEADLLESRRDFVAVIGRVTRNEEGFVTSVADVTELEPVDTRSFEIARFECDNEIYEIVPALYVIPYLDPDTKQAIIFSDDNLDIHVAAPTRAMLYEAILVDLCFAWREYAQADDSELSPASVRFKHELRDRIRKVPADAT